MIQKVESATPNSLGDIELPHQAPARSGKQKPEAASRASGEDDSKREETPQTETRLPLRPRHLGLRLDLIG